MSLIIRGPLYAGGKMADAGIRIEDGVIVAVSDADLGEADREIRLGPRQYLLPSGVDGQCAARDWRESERETVDTASKGALAGGVTVICDQANTVPRIDSTELLRERAALFAEKSYVDYGVTGHPPLDLDELEHYRSAGAHSVQFFPWDLRCYRYPRDTDDSNALFGRCAAAGLKGMIVVDELAFQQTPLEADGELYAVDALIRRLHPDFHVRLSVTRPQCVEQLAAVKDQFPNMRIQAPHHALTIDKETAFERIGSAAFHVPPLREAEEVEQMAEYAKDGTIDIVVSFHAPHRMEDKFSAEPVPGEFTPKAGYSAVDFAFPHLLTRFGVETTCRIFSENPAAHLGLKKGRIEIGFEADLVIVEEDEGLPEQNIHVTGSAGKGVWKISPTKFYSMAKVTPFVGERLQYRVLKTFLRGEEVFDRDTDVFNRTRTARIE